MKYLFIHGGPGLNSNPERHILRELFDQKDPIFFWDEPSLARQTHPRETTFNDCCESLKKLVEELATDSQIVVIAHSFGAIYFNAILPEIEQFLARIILLSPVSNIVGLDKNILTASAEDPSYAEAIVLKKYLSSFSEEIGLSEGRFNNLLVAATNPNLASMYWFQRDLMPSYFENMSIPGYEFGLNSFKSIRETCHIVNPINTSTLETEVIYGVHDPIVKITEKDQVQLVYPNSTIHEFKNSGHYSHIEECAEFMKIIYKNSFKSHMVKETNFRSTSL